jgi:hypothetical protein
MYQPNDLQIQQRRNELMQEAEMARLARIALEEKPSSSSGLPGWALAALGHRWSIWGNDPNDRFGEVEPVARAIRI